MVFDCVFLPSTESWTEIPPERIDDLSKMVSKEEAALLLAREATMLCVRAFLQSAWDLKPSHTLR